ncbi:Roquin-1 [Frankliniella fusca]|uniref:Roquin-1 n=1 Tax=Frankliniella fusca TaxID=407009 RepID=A0AAE1L5B2_9NEOP|nr:Roquin-1 [Frankliniella fusca]
MECKICCEGFDQAARVPKTVVPCGHTACLQCLHRCERRECPTCRTAYSVTPESLPNTFAVLEMMEELDKFRLRRGWCSDCRAAAARRCLDEHAVLNATASERRLQEQVPAGALQEAAALLQDVQCQGEEVLHALTLLSAPSWDLTLRAGGRQLNGTLANNEDPLIKALWVVVASRATLTESGADGPAGDCLPPAAARPPAAALDPPPAAARPPAAALDPPPAAARPPAAALDPPPAAARPPAAALDPPPAAARPPAAALDPPPAAARPPAAALDPPPAAAPPPREMCVYYLSRIVPGNRHSDVEKAAALQEAQGVVRLVHVWCHRDPIWSLELLQRAAPTVERLEVRLPFCTLCEPQLRAVHAMPRLRRLLVECEYVGGALDPAPPELGALPPGHSGLRWLSALCLPRATTESLLQAHGATLEELELVMGTPGDGEWPYSCSDLHSQLGRCGLRALRILVLRRGSYCSHTDTACREQLAAVRAALPGVQALCGKCDRVPVEDP